MRQVMDEQTKKDFLNIMKLAARKDIADNKDILKKIIRINDTTDNFKSAFGKKFIHRVKTILSGDETEFTCILCGKDKACNGFICKSCMDRYNKGVNKNSQENAAKIKKTKDHRSDKKIYRKSVLGTIMYNITSIGNKKILKQRRENNPEYQKPVSGHVFIGLYTIILLLTYLFNIYAGGIFLLLGLGIAFCAFIRKIKHFRMENLIIILLSIVFFPLGIVCLVLGIIKKIGYVYENRKYISAGLTLYGCAALICALLYDIPGYRCEPGIVGYLKMIFMGEFGTRWDRSITGATIEMVIYIIGACIFTFIVIASISVSLDEMEEYCCNNGLWVRQAFVKILQSPVEVLMMFVPLILFVLCKTESLEDGWGLDIDNNTHNVSSYSRFRNGKWENVKEYTRRNPDDIINNNLSYRGDNPYDGTNPIRNGRK